MLNDSHEHLRGASMGKLIRAGRAARQVQIHPAKLSTAFAIWFSRASADRPVFAARAADALFSRSSALSDGHHADDQLIGVTTAHGDFSNNAFEHDGPGEFEAFGDVRPHGTQMKRIVEDVKRRALNFQSDSEKQEENLKALNEAVRDGIRALDDMTHKGRAYTKQVFYDFEEADKDRVAPLEQTIPHEVAGTSQDDDGGTKETVAQEEETAQTACCDEKGMMGCWTKKHQKKIDDRAYCCPDESVDTACETGAKKTDAPEIENKTVESDTVESACCDEKGFMGCWTKKHAKKIDGKAYCCPEEEVETICEAGKPGAN